MATEDNTIRTMPPRIEDILKYYDKGYFCRNCNEHQHVWIKKGNRAPSSVTCRNCGCST